MEVVFPKEVIVEFGFYFYGALIGAIFLLYYKVLASAGSALARTSNPRNLLPALRPPPLAGRKSVH